METGHGLYLVRIDFVLFSKSKSNLIKLNNLCIYCFLLLEEIYEDVNFFLENIRADFDLELSFERYPLDQVI